MYVFKPKGSRYYRGRFRLSNGPRWYEVGLRVEQKELAVANLQKLVREKEQELLGWLPPKPLRDAALSPIAEHLAEYVADLAAQGSSKKHVALSRNRVQRLCHECGWRLLRDITPDGFTRWRARQSFAPKTCNEYLGLTSAFLNWMENAGRIAKNPLATVGKSETRGRERRTRRALTLEQFTSLVAVSGKRGLFYTLAAYTGLRRSEAKALLWSDLHLDAARPYVLARASTTKNKKQAALPLLPELVEMLKARQAAAGPGDGKVFPLGVPTAATLRSDLAKCGIPAVDEQGRRVDIHALRKTFCSLLHAAGVPQRVAQELMRHSEPRLTATVYTDADLLPLHSEVHKLARPKLPQTVTQKTGISGVFVSKTIQTDPASTDSESLEESPFVPTCPSAESGGGGGIRTHVRV
ncbi:site-specific integrase [Oleiharenicola lentus]|uniref:Site-specific integrase n=1 Tax=Oleiharenicola lentus TaxID=2508720 RepID=A0A4Q1C837_9BACT|nr:site-specific integrase [Oleiharenicola lentus]RXK55095.1 site-specific integrase [Oleiharenicola lentus]